MKTKLFSLLLCLCLLGSMTLPVLAEGGSLSISSSEAFLAFAENCRLDRYSQGLTVSLEADISLSGTEFSGVPIFCGTFLGNGHTISGLDLSQTGSAQGLFRYLSQSARVESLTVEGTVHPQGSQNTVGGIAGQNEGLIQNCAFSGTVSGSDAVGGITGHNAITGIIENCQVRGTIHGDHFVGGVAGENNGVIRGCVNRAQINTTPQQNSVALEQITLNTLTGSEAVNTVTDLGGITGTSAGVLRGCTNLGAVGYPHMGYNIGGIAGSQIGYLTDCVNHGDVNGRKEVGGIVGQMEPVANIEFSEDTLQILQGQLNDLGSLTNQASANAQGSAAAVTSQITAIQDQTQLAQDALQQLLPAEGTPTLPDPDTLQAAQTTLSNSLSSMQNSLQSIGATTQSAAGTLSRDMQAISGQIGAMGQTINGAEETLQATITDISDEDTPQDTAGKVEFCQNYGTISADLNTGGIAGAMAPENDLDPESDLDIIGDASLNFNSQLRAVILSCQNIGTVTGSKDMTGGIVGWMSMGLIKDTHALCDVSGGGSYVGGIAGQSSGFIRLCRAKGSLSGTDHVGGIAGTGTTVSDCRSMTRLTAQERLGGVLGYAGDRAAITGNVYLAVDQDPGAIDGISYDGCAQVSTPQAFFALDDLEHFFRTVTVRFQFGEDQEQVLTVDYGTALQAKDIPQLPEKEGQLAAWEGLSLEPLTFDAEYPLTYTPRQTVIQSEDGSLLAQGSFDPDASLLLLPEDVAPSLSQGQTLIGTLSFTLSGSSAPASIRCPKPAEGDLLVLLRQADGTWSETAYEEQGSYLVFPVNLGESHVAFVAPAPFPWLMAGCVTAGVLLAAVFLILLLKKKRP